MKYKILDRKRAMKKDRRGMERWWESEKGVSDKLLKQDMTVKEPIKLPMVRKKDTVFVFAGSTGEISSRITGSRVVHSDADPRRVRIARERFGKRYDDVLAADAVNLPTKNVDWLFSFEPSPLMTRPYFVPRAIASSKKGFIISRRPGFYAFLGLRKIAELYGIAPKEVSRKLVSADVYDGKNANKLAKRKLNFVVFESNPRAKRLAEIDNRVIGRLGSKPRGRKISGKDVEKLRKELGISEREMRRSLKRVNEIVSLQVPGVSVKGRYPKHLELPNIEVEY